MLNDSWRDFQVIYLQDPSNYQHPFFGSGYHKTIKVLYVTYNRDWNKIINDYSKPTSELMNESIAEITTDKFIGEHLRGGRGSFLDYNCACCGGGLEHDARETPLPEKLSDLLIKEGFKFKTDPALARAQEREEWKKYVKRNNFR